MQKYQCCVSYNMLVKDDQDRQIKSVIKMLLSKENWQKQHEFKKLCRYSYIWLNTHVLRICSSIKGKQSKYGTYDLNSLVPGCFELNCRYVFFNVISLIDGYYISCEIRLRWMLLGDKFALVHFCMTAPSHCLFQCRPRSMSPYGVTSPQWVINVALIE